MTAIGMDLDNGYYELVIASVPNEKRLVLIQEFKRGYGVGSKEAMSMCNSLPRLFMKDAYISSFRRPEAEFLKKKLEQEIQVEVYLRSI